MTYAIERILDRLEEEGRQQGLEEGIEKGIEKGKLEATMKIAKAMLVDQDSFEKIGRVTQLPVSTIEKLRDEISNHS